MKICVIYDKKGKAPCFVSLSPNKDVFIRELSQACKEDKKLYYSLYPEDYVLYEIDMSDIFLSNYKVESVEFTDFLCKEVSSNE